MKLSVFLMISLVSMQGNLMAQENQQPILRGYENREYVYFDSLNRLHSNSLVNLNNSYFFYTTFRIDTNSTIMDIEFLEVPGAEVPQMVKNYVTHLIGSTNRKWLPQMKYSKRVVSDEMVYLVTILKKGQKIEDAIKNNDPIIEYFFGRTKPLNQKLEELILAKNKKYLAISY